MSGSPGLTIFLTGLPAAGKSTIARALSDALAAAGHTVTLLDGDAVRTLLSTGLGFSKADRDMNVKRIGFVAAEVTKHGGIAVCAAVAPYDDARSEVRRMVERVGRFVLVYVATPLDVCEGRDPKGLYARARAGALPHFTGVSDPYEAPADAELTIDTSVTSLEAAVALILKSTPGAAESSVPASGPDRGGRSRPAG